MIDKKEAQKAGIKIADSHELPTKRTAHLLAQLKALLPNVINSDGAIDVNALKTAVGAEVAVDANSRGYTLNFAGKGLAKTMADAPTEKELKIEMTQSKNFDDTENMVIRGDNIEALKLLMQNYEGKVKMIYIDPPYNTASENFIYKDNFRQTDEQLINDLDMQDEAIDFLQTMYGTRTHSGWLSFMYPRLKLARDLLTDDGVIFISIDDNEQANLKLICDEIFGEESFVANIIWEKKYSPANDSRKISPTHDFILAYAKNVSNWKMGLFERTAEMDARYKNSDNDPRGDWKAGGLSAKTYSKNYDYEITTPSRRVVSPPSGKSWSVSKEKFNKMLGDNRIYFGVSNNSKPQIKQFLSEVQSGLVPKSIWFKEDVGHNQISTQELEKLFSVKVFDNPKPVTLVEKMLRVGNVFSDNIVLDFFAGSGTTGEAVMRLNADDGGNRKFILVQLDEKISKKTNHAAHNFCVKNKFEPVISSITVERLNRAGGKIKESLDSKQSACVKGKTCPDVGYKVFSLQNRPEVNTDENHQLRINMNHRTPQDTLYNMIAASGTELHRKITVVEENILYEVAGAYYVLGACKTDIADESNKPIYIDGYADISLDDWMNMVGPDKENLTILY